MSPFFLSNKYVPVERFVLFSIASVLLIGGLKHKIVKKQPIEM